jgi:hypothetical protein
MPEDEDNRPLPAPSSRTTERLDTAAVVAGFVPVLGGPVAGILSGWSNELKLRRVHEVLVGFAQDLRDARSEAAKQYVSREDFAELMEKTVRAAADERREEKRRLYRSFLVGAATVQAAYDEQVRVLRVLEEVHPQHLPILRAMDQEPVDEDRLMGSQLQTLHRRLGLPRELIEELVVQLHDLRLVGLTRDSLHTVMSATGAEDLRRWITPLGRRLMDYLRTAPS